MLKRGGPRDRRDFGTVGQAELREHQIAASTTWFHKRALYRACRAGWFVVSFAVTRSAAFAGGARTENYDSLIWIKVARDGLRYPRRVSGDRRSLWT